MLVNNRSEGNAPLTVQGLSEMLYHKGPVPFGTEPCASDFAMLPLFFHNVSIVLLQFFSRAFLKHVFTLWHLRNSAYEE